ncbi:MAG: pyridoxamine 5'-phosphate oxidase family protein [Gammaproteobacteria bacterium]|nr:pyridoxamine 5'-phosphate oxidase family protein [Gammaproteobacteria bacterium]
MAYRFLDIALTPAVRTVQEQMNADRIWSDFKGHRAFDRFSDNVAAYIAERDGFYIATVSETGWPYVQYRGGPCGFLKVLDERTLAFADYRGNRQYISTGNASADGRACLLLMDYAQRARLKMYVRVEVLALDDDPVLTQRASVPGYKVKLERIFRLHLQAYDWNCSQHITARFTEQQINEAVRPLHERLNALESENAALRTRLTNRGETP